MSKAVFIMGETPETTFKMQHDAIAYLRTFIHEGDTVYAKLVYRTASNLPGATRGYGLMAICRETGKICNITHEVACITGTRFQSDEPQYMQVKGETVESVVKCLSICLFNGDNSKLSTEVWY